MSGVRGRFCVTTVTLSIEVILALMIAPRSKARPIARLIGRLKAVSYIAPNYAGDGAIFGVLPSSR
ncbi:MAG: hypothetical protein ACOX8P_01315 [Tepidanaerobacteraceae bacterium]